MLKEDYFIRHLSYLVSLVLVGLTSPLQSFDQLNLSFSSWIGLYCLLLSMPRAVSLYLLFGNRGSEEMPAQKYDEEKLEDFEE